MAYIFDRILKQGAQAGHYPGKEKSSVNWFRRQAKQATVSTTALLKGDVERLKTDLNRTDVGSMYMFFYDPKHKQTLPYYDRFPLIFPFKFTPDGFYGINLHYLPHTLRARMMDALYPLVSDDNFDRSTRLKGLSYDLLNGSSKFKWFRPCVKRYLNRHVRSRFVFVEPSEWDIALFLPVEKFQKASKEQVWRDSRRVI